MAQHHPWHGMVRDLLSGGELGALRSVESRICFPLGEDRLARLPAPAYGGGVFCDVAPYWLHLLQAVAGLAGEVAEAAGSFEGDRGETEFTARLALRGACKATLYASYLDPFAATHTLHCEDGSITVADFLRPMWGNVQVKIAVSAPGGARTLACAGGGFYANQLRAFAAAVAEPVGAEAHLPALERIAVMERVYRHACSAAGVPPPHPVL